MPSDDEKSRTAVDELLRRFARPAAEFTACGTAALEVALEVLGIGRGDEVVVPDIGCHSVAAAVVRSGAIPVFVGVSDALTLSPGEVAEAWSHRTRAVVAVHQYGLPCDVRGIVDAVPPDVAVIEDVAQTWGSYVGEAVAGSTGTLAVVSFGPSKPVALGGGGAVLGPARALAGAVGHGDIGDRGLGRPPSSARFPMPLLQGLADALGRADAQLAARRSAVARFLDSELSAHFRLPPLAPDSGAGWTRLPLYPIRPPEHTSCAQNAQLLDALRAFGDVQQMHDLPPSGLPMFRGCDKRVVPGSKRQQDPFLVKLG